LQTAINPAAIGEIFNIGIDKPTTFLELAQKIIAIAGTGHWEFTPFTPERAAQEPGDFYSDITKIRQKIGWKPVVSLDEGINRTVDYYRSSKHTTGNYYIPI